MHQVKAREKCGSSPPALFHAMDLIPGPLFGSCNGHSPSLNSWYPPQTQMAQFQPLIWTSPVAYSTSTPSRKPSISGSALSSPRLTILPLSTGNKKEARPPTESLHTYFASLKFTNTFTAMSPAMITFLVSPIILQMPCLKIFICLTHTH